MVMKTKNVYKMHTVYVLYLFATDRRQHRPRRHDGVKHVMAGASSRGSARYIEYHVVRLSIHTQQGRPPQCQYGAISAALLQQRHTVSGGLAHINCLVVVREGLNVAAAMSDNAVFVHGTPPKIAVQATAGVVVMVSVRGGLVFACSKLYGRRM